MYHLTRHQSLAFMGGSGIRIHGADIKSVDTSKNIGYNHIYNNLGGEVKVKTKKIKGGADVEEIHIYEDDALEFGMNYSVGIIE